MTGIRKARAQTDHDYDNDAEDVLDHDGEVQPPTAHAQRVYMGDVIGGRGVVRSPDDEAFLRNLYADSGEWT